MSPADERFFGAIGRFTVSWAWLELGLDISVSVIHRHLNGEAIQSEAPWSLQRKLDYLRAAPKKLLPLASYRQRITALADAVELMLETRHDIIHGCIIEHTEGTGSAVMARLRRGEGSKPKAFAASADDVLNVAILADKIAGQSLELGDELRAKFSPM